MRIAFLTSEFVSEKKSFDGGLSRYLLKTAIQLKKHGHKPVVVVTSDSNEVINYNDIEVHRVKPKNTFLYKIADKLSNFKYQKSLDILRDSYFLNKKIKELNKIEKIDIIQYPNFKSISFFSTRKIKSVLRISRRLGPQRTKSAIDSIDNEDWENVCKSVLDYYDRCYEHELIDKKDVKILNMEGKNDIEVIKEIIKAITT